MASAILFAVVCWGSRLRVAHANRLNKLIRKASDIVGMELDTLSAVSDRRMLLEGAGDTAACLSPSPQCSGALSTTLCCLMKTLERLVLTHLHPLVGPFMGPFQFAFQPGIGVDDAIIFLLDRSLPHLEEAWKHCEDYVL